MDFVSRFNPLLKNACFLSLWPLIFLANDPAHAQSAFNRDSFLISFSEDLQIELVLHSDRADTPLFYSSNIFTQVCETGKCKPVRILLFWDLLGNYTHFDLSEGSILTKLDHVPFSDHDYKKFGSILADPHSILEDLEISELITNKEKASLEEIDGITGATPKSISNAIVEGAVYTCYTIWHLANGHIRDHIQKLTDSICSTEPLLDKLVTGDNPDIRRWTISKIFMHHSSYPSLTRKIISSINPKNIFESKFILSEIPPSQLSLPWVQQILWTQYPQFHYAQQILILERFQGIPIDANLKVPIQKLVLDGNEKQKSLARQLVFESKR